MVFVGYKTTVDDGDLVLLVRGPMSIFPLTVKTGGQLHSKDGVWNHDQIIGKPFGHKTYSSTGYYAFVLHPTPELWTLCLPHRTQIIYTADISMIMMYLDLGPGCVVVESGTGSASLSHAFARAVAPTGHLHTFDFHEGRAKAASDEMKEHRIDHLVTVRHRDVVGEGFGLTDIADAVFLDLPKPWDVVGSAKQALKPTGGRFCSFSPCIEQVQKTCDRLRELGFTDIETMETLIRPYKVHESAIPFINYKQPAASENGGVEEVVKETEPAGMEEDAGSGDEDKARGVKRTVPDGSPATSKSITMPTARAVEEIAGHTGYLTFAQLWRK